jgi:hypothetical protein
MRQKWLVAEAVRTLSQLRVGYRRSHLSVEGTPRRRSGPRPGDRLPDETVTCDGRTGRLHEMVATPGVHVLLDRDAADVAGTPLGPLVHVHRVTSRPGSGLVAVRPDGHVGFRCGRADAGQLRAWLSLVAGSPTTSAV